MNHFERRCLKCGRVFSVMHINGDDKKYCSASCRRRSARARKRDAAAIATARAIRGPIGSDMTYGNGINKAMGGGR